MFAPPLSFISQFPAMNSVFFFYFDLTARYIRRSNLRERALASISGRRSRVPRLRRGGGRRPVASSRDASSPAGEDCRPTLISRRSRLIADRRRDLFYVSTSLGGLASDGRKGAATNGPHDIVVLPTSHFDAPCSPSTDGRSGRYFPRVHNYYRAYHLSRQTRVMVCMPQKSNCRAPRWPVAIRKFPDDQITDRFCRHSPVNSP